MVCSSRNLCDHGLTLRITREDQLMLRRFTGRIAATTLVLATGLGAAVAFAADEPANIIKYRQNYMKANGGHIAMIAAMVKGEVSWTDELAGPCPGVARAEQAPAAQLFPEGTGKGDTEAESAGAAGDLGAAGASSSRRPRTSRPRARSWSRWPRAATWPRSPSRWARSARKGCGGCHETFREKKD